MADQTAPNRDRENRQEEFSWGRIALRLVITAVVLAITAFFTPGFRITGIWALIVGAIVITLVDYLIEKFTGIDASPFGRGIVGFAVAAAIIYFTQFLVAGFAVTFWGAIIGALVIGVLNAIIPGRTM